MSKLTSQDFRVTGWDFREETMDHILMERDAGFILDFWKKCKAQAHYRKDTGRLAIHVLFDEKPLYVFRGKCTTFDDLNHIHRLINMN